MVKTAQRDSNGRFAPGHDPLPGGGRPPKQRVEFSATELGDYLRANDEPLLAAAADRALSPKTSNRDFEKLALLVLRYTRGTVPPVDVQGGRGAAGLQNEVSVPHKLRSNS